MFLAGSFLASSLAAGQTSLLYGTSTGTAKAEIQGPVLSLSNQAMQAQWSVAESKLTFI